MTDPTGERRLIEWTGERFVPWAPDVPIAYEHLHRYLWASEIARGRRVLDVASGEGYGASILASVAESVLGIDVDEAAVEHSRLKYRAANLEFRAGSALDLASIARGPFDLVVAFEIIEHLTDQERLLDEIKRVLTPGGLLLTSTPEREAYARVRAGEENPFHERELTLEELESLLASRFEHVRAWGQRTISGSRIAAVGEGGDAAGSTFFVERVGNEWVRRDEPHPIYLLGAASDGEPKVPSPESILADPGLELLHAGLRRIAAERDAALSEAGASAREAMAMHDELEHLRRVARHAEAELARPSWQIFKAIRGRLLGAIGEDSAVARALRWILVVTVNLLRGRRWSQGLKRRIAFPRCDEPLVSLVIPVHAQPKLTEACLNSIVQNTQGVPYEVIIVNDTADPSTSRVLDSARNARLIVNEANLGFTRSVNRGAAEARGRYLVLCNNDIEVRPGWLDAMIECAESAPDIGIVTPKFVDPEGKLSEAGGLVWRDGTAANFGRGDYPDYPIYNYRREVDYGSAAALLVRAGLWKDIGGFDERYSPAYYEDTDLCFAARERGLRVVYEPAAEVVHAEGSSQGTDAASGGKRHQELNRPKFAAKWASQLERQAAPPESAEDVRRARDRAAGERVLVVDHRIPTPDMDSGSVRMMHILRALLSLGCSVTFVPGDLWRAEPYCRQLQAMGIEVLYGPMNLRRELAELGDRLRLAILSRAMTAIDYVYLIRELAPQARLVYDTVDLHFLRETRRAELERGGETAAARAAREIELALVRACDVTVCVSEAERALVRTEVPEATVEVISNAHEPATSVPPPAKRHDLVFLGGFDHQPNIDAARYLVDSIMPLVWRELGDVRLKVVGSQAPDEVRDLASDRVEVAGWVEEIEPVLGEARAMVAPLRYGAGVKGKITQSIALGLPVVTSTIGAEGIDATDGREMLIADDPASFAERVVRVCRDDELWLRLSTEGRRLAQRQFSVESISERVRALLDGALGEAPRPG